MGTRINTNTLAMNAARYGQINDAKVASSIEKLSSGLRINRAADDAAGLVISESLRAQVSGLDQAIRNSNEAANMVKTAEGALSEVHDLLRTMRTLAVHASNTGANDATSIAADQAQIGNAIKSLDRIASSTSFGNLKLLDGTASTIATANTANLKASAAGSTARGTYAVDVTTAGSKGTATGTAVKFSRAEGTTTGVTTFAALAVGSTVTFSDAGSTLGVPASGVTVNLAGATDLQGAADRINNDAEASKYVTASVYNDGTDDFLRFESKAATTAAGAAQFTYTFNAAATGTALGFAGATGTGTAQVVTSDKVLGAAASYTFNVRQPDGTNGPDITFSVNKGDKVSDVISNFNAFAATNKLGVTMELDENAGTLKLTNNDVGLVRGVTTTLASGTDLAGIAPLDTANTGTDMVLTVNGETVAASDINGSKVSISASSGADLKAAIGLSFTVGDPTSTSASDGVITVGGGSLKFQIGANAGDQTEIEIASASTNKLGKDVVDGKTLADIDVTTAQGAQDAIKIIDQAIADISKTRAELGAFQSQVLESNVRSLGVAKENLTASESTIRDTDMAAEMVNFTKNNILTQASQAMLSQANNSSQGILQLLRG